MKNSWAGTGISIVIVALAACWVAPTLAAMKTSTWKWQDAEGNITYGDKPPKGVQAERVRISTGTSSTAPAVAADTPEKQSSGDNEEQKMAALQGVSPERAKALCQQATGNLEILANSALVRQTNESGEVHILDESEKQAQMQTARDIMKDYCH